MALQVVLFRARKGESHKFARAMEQALPILRAAEGYRDHRFAPGIDEPDAHVLLVWWRAVDDHVIGFRQSARYGDWRALLDGHIYGEPYVRHFSLPA
ncbi:antibiotic biosynthesis monooxygenase [Variovorax sp. J22P168]|uniref:antibiotic biosynthesis monooxygenase family protein n=1 Tax=Variovorax jilinensis TaxID=3053513 RepID=UPI002578EF87|nr:antibiotic biosynthesis monooxygenase [Variovorax sp. J22P168]MDM0012013.1 antibiotic biosynthesis monooxygenase [Variovorax sp. J22P168]